MNGNSARIPSSSQTVGPYFRIGLEYLVEQTPLLTLDTPGIIEVRGRVFDRDGAPVPDAMLEFWSGSTDAQGSNEPGARGSFPRGFRRAPTDGDGGFSALMERPATALRGSEHAQAPHMLVLVFARGLLRHLITRVYLGDEQANESDPVLMKIPEMRRATLIARPDESRAGLYRWDVILQGPGETVFFAW
jgi:protocatechuate 3,4-dioxygenase, alpha subunit